MIELLMHQSEAVQVGSVCDLIARPADFDGKLISVRGTFNADWRHPHLIVGEPCDKGVIFAGDTSALGERWQRIWQTRGNPDVAINLTVTGRFHWDSQAPPQMYPATHVIEVQEIVALDIQAE